MKTLELEIKLMEKLWSKGIIVPNVWWGMGLNYEADLVCLSRSNYCTEIEIKVSKSDLKADKKKKHCHDSNLFKYLYFAVPEAMKDYALLHIPERAGLYVVKPKWVEKVRNAEKNPACIKWTDKQRQKLMYLGTMRILGLKKNLLKARNE